MLPVRPPENSRILLSSWRSTYSRTRRTAYSRLAVIFCAPTTQIRFDAAYA